MNLKSFLFGSISFIKKISLIKRILAFVVLPFLLVKFYNDYQFNKQNKVIQTVSLNSLTDDTSLPDYFKLNNYYIDTKVPLAVHKIRKKNKHSHFILPLVKEKNSTQVIAFVKDYKTRKIDAYSIDLIRNELNNDKNSFEKLESSLSEAEKNHFTQNGYALSENIPVIQTSSPTKFGTFQIVFVVLSFIVLILILLSFIPSSLLNKLFDRYTGIDYTFGFKKIKKVLTAVENGNYEKADTLLQTLSLDEKTQAIEALSLMVSDSKFEKWRNNGRDSNLFKITNASRLLHEAWEKRGYKFANETDESNFIAFKEAINKIPSKLQQVQGHLKPLALNLLIKTYKGIGDPDTCLKYFNECTLNNPTYIAPHLSYQSVILPKWYGDDETVHNFTKEHSKKEKLLNYLLNSALVHENEDHDEINNFLISNHNEVKSLKKDNPYIYILYNYMYLLASEVENKKLFKFYDKKLNNYLSTSLYPPLRSEQEIEEKLG
ncbi:hypothetical protein [Tenacibaculum sp. 190524A02b]|uniref:hypothetical protein n=1 Tax=Tenacibaculum vairaonense TaxID=3137860 RepID=UPI0031FA705C